MAPERPTMPMTAEERVYVTLRVVMLVCGLVLHSLHYLPATQVLQSELSMWALMLTAIATVMIIAAALLGRARVSRSMLWVLPVDLITVSVYTWILVPVDGFFGVVMLLVVLYAMTVPRREAVMASVAFALAYAVGHIAPPPATAFDAVLVGLKTSTVVIVGVLVASAMERARRHEDSIQRSVLQHEDVNEKLARRVSELQAISEISDVIHSSLDFDDVGPLVLEILAKVIDVEQLAFFVLDKETSETVFSANVGVPQEEQRRRSPLALGQVEEHMTCTRVIDHARLVVLFCAPAEDLDRLTDDDRFVVNAVSSELVIAIENSRLFKLTKRLAVTDELTGLSNYRYLQQRLDDEISRARRYDKHLSMLMLDADDFKGFNDRYGHLAGDRALTELSTVLLRAVREVDIVARYGGEEFAVVLPETDAPGAFVVAEKIRELVATHLFEDADGVPCCTLTVSIGVSTYPTYALDKESLLREADDALYRAKNSSKNRVCAPQRTTEPQPEPTLGE